MSRCGEAHPEAAERRCILPDGTHGDHADASGSWPNAQVQAVVAERKERRPNRKKGRTLLADFAANATRREPPPGHRHGETYEAEFDYERLNLQMRKVYDCLRDGQWWTLGAIGVKTNCPEASVSARIRDLRKPEFGGLEVERRRAKHGAPGLYEYRLVQGG